MSKTTNSFSTASFGLDRPVDFTIPDLTGMSAPPVMGTPLEIPGQGVPLDSPLLRQTPHYKATAPINPAAAEGIGAAPTDYSRQGELQPSPHLIFPQVPGPITAPVKLDPNTPYHGQNKGGALPQPLGVDLGPIHLTRAGSAQDITLGVSALVPAFENTFHAKAQASGPVLDAAAATPQRKLEM